MRVERELMRGSGSVAVLQLLAAGEMYGYELADALDRQSDGILAMGQSTLYPLLYALEAKGLVASRTTTGPNGRTRRYYAITAEGKRELAHQREQWRALDRAMRALGVLDPVPAT